MGREGKYDYFVIEGANEPMRGGIATAALRMCCVCDHVVAGMGGPGSGTLCCECATLLRRGQIKIDRDKVLEASKAPK